MIRQNRCACGNMNSRREESAPCGGCATLPADVVNTCGMKDGSNGFSYAMAYIPTQEYEELYQPEEALCKGTLFKQLNMPFHGCFRI